MIAKRPPMGWNTWNTFGRSISEEVVLGAADCLIKSGLAAKGYTYIVIDDCWSLPQRDAQGRLVPDPEKFPHGMKYIADYLHAKGLKFGMYSCAGNLTCGGHPGSFEHEFVDAATFAAWDVDFLKYDYCYHSKVVHGRYFYRRMGLALANCGRDILFSACSWGEDDTARWIRETGADMWRSTYDIADAWHSVTKLSDEQEAVLPFGGVGCVNDMDMLVVGMHGKGYVGVEDQSDTQYKSHFSLWCLFGSPLMIGCDIREMSEPTRCILTNRDLIAIDQDEDQRQVIKLEGIWGGPDKRLFARFLADGDIAVGCFNFGSEPIVVSFTLDELGLNESTGKTLAMRELWTGETLTVENALFQHQIAPYDCLIYRCRIVDK